MSGQNLVWQTRLRVPPPGHGGNAEIPEGIVPFDGIAYIELDDSVREWGGLDLADDASDRLQPCSGTIIASGDARYPVGAHALLFLYWGQQVYVDYTHGSYRAKNQVRACGLAVVSAAYRLIEKMSLPEIIPALIEDGAIRPVGDWVLIARPEAVKERSGIILPDSMVTGMCKGVVLAIGEQVKTVDPGDHVQYSAASMFGHFAEVLDLGKRLGYDGKDLILVREEHLLCKFL